jgi:hypothetical protein
VFFPRVAIVNDRGDHLRHIPGEAARILVEAGTAQALPAAGRIRRIELTQPASSYAHRIGEASAAMLGGTKFYRWVRLEGSSSRIVEHHPRAYEKY